MMDLIRQWLLSVTGAAILAALADGVMPEGGIRQVGRLACGLMLLAAVLRPLAGLDMTDFPEELLYDIPHSQQLEEETHRRMKQLIEEEFSAYSMDKAQAMGIACGIRVCCQQEESGIFLPRGAEISGITEREEQEAVAAMLRVELGLPEDGLLFEEGGRR